MGSGLRQNDKKVVYTLAGLKKGGVSAPL